MASVLRHASPSASVVGAPVAVIAGHQTTSNEQDQVHKPPDSQTSQGEQFSDCSAGVAQAETVNPETTQEEGVQQCGDEVVSSVPLKKTARKCKQGDLAMARMKYEEMGDKMNQFETTVI